MDLIIKATYVVTTLIARRVKSGEFIMQYMESMAGIIYPDLKKKKSNIFLKNISHQTITQ